MLARERLFFVYGPRLDDIAIRDTQLTRGTMFLDPFQSPILRTNCIDKRVLVPDFSTVNFIIKEDFFL